MDGLTDILVGRTETEDDAFVGYPPRGFEYYVIYILFAYLNKNHIFFLFFIRYKIKQY